jgi:hypothetical protein
VAALAGAALADAEGADDDEVTAIGVGTTGANAEGSEASADVESVTATLAEPPSLECDERAWHPARPSAANVQTAKRFMRGV